MLRILLLQLVQHLLILPVHVPHFGLHLVLHFQAHILHALVFVGHQFFEVFYFFLELLPDILVLLSILSLPGELRLLL